MRTHKQHNNNIHNMAAVEPNKKTFFVIPEILKFLIVYTKLSTYAKLNSNIAHTKHPSGPTSTRMPFYICKCEKKSLTHTNAHFYLILHTSMRIYAFNPYVSFSYPFFPFSPSSPSFPSSSSSCH